MFRLGWLQTGQYRSDGSTGTLFSSDVSDSSPDVGFTSREWTLPTETCVLFRLSDCFVDIRSKGFKSCQQLVESSVGRSGGSP